MRFRVGMPPAVSCRLVEARKLVTDYSKVHVIALMVGIFVVGPMLYAAWRLRWSNHVIFGVFDQPPGIFLGTLAAIIVVHELVHLLAHPWMGLSRHSFVGFLPKSFLFYAAYNGEHTRRRAIAILLSPLVMLTVVPYLVSTMVPVTWVPFLASLSTINGLAASGDVLLIYQVLKTVPSSAVLHGEYYGFPPSSV
jgi:hypothetical protein